LAGLLILQDDLGHPLAQSLPQLEEDLFHLNQAWCLRILVPVDGFINHGFCFGQ
jgi:hypothetical protein